MDLQHSLIKTLSSVWLLKSGRLAIQSMAALKTSCLGDYCIMQPFRTKISCQPHPQAVYYRLISMQSQAVYYRTLRIGWQVFDWQVFDFQLISLSISLTLGTNTYLTHKQIPMNVLSYLTSVRLSKLHIFLWYNIQKKGNTSDRRKYTHLHLTVCRKGVTPLTGETTHLLNSEQLHFFIQRTFIIILGFKTM